LEKSQVDIMREPILVINAGSSSVKFSVFETMADRSLAPRAHGEVEAIAASPHLRVDDPRGSKLADQSVNAKDQDGAIAAIHYWFADPVPEIVAVRVLSETLFDRRSCVAAFQAFG
jgi:acetate kinase